MEPIYKFVLEVKARLGIPMDDLSRDEAIRLALTDAQSFFMDYCNRDDIPERAEPLIARLAVILHSRNEDQYRQGIAVGDYSVTSFMSGEDVPKSVLRQLNQHKKGRAVSFK